MTKILTLLKLEMPNNHYVPKFLTSPWKKKGESLWHFDFRTEQFSDKFSLETLFAKNNLWPSNLESYLNSESENLSGDARKKLTEKLLQPNSKEYQSLFLLVLLQASRSSYYKGLSKDLEEIVNYDDAKLNQLVSAASVNHGLFGISLPPNCRLFFPETGIFPFPVLGSHGYTWIFLLPYDRDFCLCLAPHSLNLVEVFTQVNFEHLVYWSVGTSAFCDRIIIPPELYENKSNPSVLANALKEVRAYVDSQVSAINQLNEIVTKLKSLF